MPDNEYIDIPDGTDPRWIVPSPDATQVAYVVEDDAGQHVEINGRAEDSYDAIFGLTFSPDSSKVAYVGLRERSLMLTFGSEVWGPYDDMASCGPAISPDSQHIAYTADRGSEKFAFVDGESIGGPYGMIMEGGVLFSPDSQRTAYAIQRGRKWQVVVDGVEQELFASVGNRSLIFSPDSKKLAYVGYVREGGMFRKRMKVGVVIDGELGTLYDCDVRRNRGDIHEIVFSPDSKRTAYLVQPDDRVRWVIDGVDGKLYDNVAGGWPWERDWTGYPDHEKTMWRQQRLKFSPDSLHFAYAGIEGDEYVVVYDGQERNRHAAVFAVPFLFSPDSQCVAYMAGDGENRFCVVDWQARESHCFVNGEMSFSPDSSLHAYIGVDADNNDILFAGPHKWKLDGSPLAGARLVWDASDRLHTLLAKEGRIWVGRFQVS